MSGAAVSTSSLAATLTPFLYPCLDSSWTSSSRALRNVIRTNRTRRSHPPVRHQTTAASPRLSDDEPSIVPAPTVDVTRFDHLDPQLPDYSSAPFTDTCTLNLHAGAGGHGCISFLREKYIANGPPNGGDGGTGGNVYIQAVQGETSLHKLARRSILKAARGRNGEGGLRGGKRGEDLLVTVPVGTVVREIGRRDPIVEEERGAKSFGRDWEEDEPEDEEALKQRQKWRRDKWLIYPGALPKSFSWAEFPALPRPRRSNLAASQPSAPIYLDLSKPTPSPILLAAGAMGGLGNPHFVTKSLPRPKFATKGESSLSLQLQLELKLLADVGLVGLPNAGKSTLLRALTRSRTRIGDWAFTTLAPNIGTVVLDSHSGRAAVQTRTRRENFTIADIPGLIEDAHLDRGLGLGFLRHIERAGILAFVVDLSAGDAVDALKALWREVGEYEKLREHEVNSETERVMDEQDGMVKFEPFASSISPGFDPEPILQSGDGTVIDPDPGRALPPLSLPPISSKPWLVVASKADLPETQENFVSLQKYLAEVQAGSEEHPTGKKNAWRRELHAVPVSAMRKEGVERITDIILGLLDHEMK